MTAKTGLKGRHKVPKAVYDRNHAIPSAELELQRAQRRLAAAEKCSADQRALDARIAAERRANAGLTEKTAKRGRLVFVKGAPAPEPAGASTPATRPWNMQDVIYNLRWGYSVAYVSWRTGYSIEVVQAVADGL